MDNGGSKFMFKIDFSDTEIEEYLKYIRNGRFEFMQLKSGKLYRFFTFLLTNLYNPSHPNSKMYQVLINRSIYFLNSKDKHLSKSVGICGATWVPGMVCFKCKTCEIDPTCAICSECFMNGNHEGHDYAMVTTSSGICDCGDTDSWSEMGFCKHHKGPDADPLAHVPEEILKKAQDISDSLIFSLMNILLSPEKRLEKKLSDDTVVSTEPKVDTLIELLLSIISSYACFKRMFSISLVKYEGLQILLPLQTTFILINRTALFKLYNTLISDSLFKPYFAQQFINVYETYIMGSTKYKSTKNCPLSSITVQLFTIPNLIKKMIIPQKFIPKVLDTILKVINDTNSHIVGGRKVIHLKDFKPGIFFHLMVELQYLFNFESTSMLLLTNPTYFEKFCEILSHYQYSYILKRNNKDDIMERWREVASSEFWRVPKILRMVMMQALPAITRTDKNQILPFLKHLLSEIFKFHKEFNSFTKNIDVDNSNTTPKNTNPERVIDGNFSYHIPLHHLLGFLLHCMLVDQNHETLNISEMLVSAITEISSEQNLGESESVSSLLYVLVLYPLRNIAALQHVTRGFWKRNDMSILNISEEYAQYKDYTILNDSFLVRLILPIIINQEKLEKKEKLEKSKIEISTISKIIDIFSFDGSDYFRVMKFRSSSATLIQRITDLVRGAGTEGPRPGDFLGAMTGNGNDGVEGFREGLLDAALEFSSDKFLNFEGKESREEVMETDVLRIMLRLLFDTSYFSGNPADVATTYILDKLFLYPKGINHKFVKAAVPKIIKKRMKKNQSEKSSSTSFDSLLGTLSKFKVVNNYGSYALADESLWKHYCPYRTTLISPKIIQILRNNHANIITQKSELKVSVMDNISRMLKFKNSSLSMSVVEEGWARIFVSSEMCNVVSVLLFREHLRSVRGEEPNIDHLSVTLHFLYCSIVLFSKHQKKEAVRIGDDEVKKTEDLIRVRRRWHEVPFSPDFLSSFSNQYRFLVKIKKKDEKDEEKEEDSFEEKIVSVSKISVLYDLLKQGLLDDEIRRVLKTLTKCVKKRRRKDVMRELMRHRRSYETHVKLNQKSEEDEHEHQKMRQGRAEKRKLKMLQKMQKMAKKFEQSIKDEEESEKNNNDESSKISTPISALEPSSPFPKFKVGDVSVNNKIVNKEEEEVEGEGENDDETCVFCNAKASPISNSENLVRLINFSKSQVLKIVGDQSIARIIKLCSCDGDVSQEYLQKYRNSWTFDKLGGRIFRILNEKNEEKVEIKKNEEESGHISSGQPPPLDDIDINIAEAQSSNTIEENNSSVNMVNENQQNQGQDVLVQEPQEVVHAQSNLAENVGVVGGEEEGEEEGEGEDSSDSDSEEGEGEEEEEEGESSDSSGESDSATEDSEGDLSSEDEIEYEIPLTPVQQHHFINLIHPTTTNEEEEEMEIGEPEKKKARKDVGMFAYNEYDIDLAREKLILEKIEWMRDGRKKSEEEKREDEIKKTKLEIYRIMNLQLDNSTKCGVHLTGCGHKCHKSCFHSYFMSLLKSSSDRVRFKGSEVLNLSNSEILCPVCVKLQNSFIPVPGAEADKIDKIDETKHVKLEEDEELPIQKILTLKNTSFEAYRKHPCKNRVSEVSREVNDSGNEYQFDKERSVEYLQHVKQILILMNCLGHNLKIHEIMDRQRSSEEDEDELSIFMCPRLIEEFISKKKDPFEIEGLKKLRERWGEQESKENSFSSTGAIFEFSKALEILKECYFPMLCSILTREEEKNSTCLSILKMIGSSKDLNFEGGQFSDGLEGMNYPFLMMDMFSTFLKYVMVSGKFMRILSMDEEAKMRLRFGEVVREFYHGFMLQIYVFIAIVRHNAGIIPLEKEQNGLVRTLRQKYQKVLDDNSDAEGWMQFVKYFRSPENNVIGTKLFSNEENSKVVEDMINRSCVNFMKQCLLLYSLYMPKEHPNWLSLKLFKLFSGSTSISSGLLSEILEFFKVEPFSCTEELTKTQFHWFDNYFEAYQKYLQYEIKKFPSIQNLTNSYSFVNFEFVPNTLIRSMSKFGSYQFTDLPKNFQHLYLENKNVEYCESCNIKNSKPYINLQRVDEKMQVGHRGNLKRLCKCSKKVKKTHEKNIFNFINENYGGQGMFLSLKRSTLFCIYGNGRRVLHLNSPYRDKYNQQDIGFRFGKPLMLQERYLSQFYPFFVMNCFDQNTKWLRRSKLIVTSIFADDI